MWLCIDIGNSQLCGGIFDNDKLLLQFRYDTKHIGSSDQLGLFLRSVISENGLNYKYITKIGISSVVPSVDYTVRAACIKYLSYEPIFLRAGIKTGITVNTDNPNEVGSDLIAASIGVKELYSNQDCLIFDLGTATTCCYLNKEGEFVGAAIAPGIKLMMDSLHSNTAKLMGVNIVRPEHAIGKNTRNAIQAGIYYAQLGLIEQLIAHTMLEYGFTTRPLIIGTGGFSNLFLGHKVFDHIIPELLLIGLRQMIRLNEQP